MTFAVVHQANGGARSPFHIVETTTGREVEWVNRFLDRECVRCLANTTLRSYAMDLLHFLRWWAGVNHTDAIAENALALLPDYVRFQAGSQPRSAPATVNRRVIVAGCTYATSIRMPYTHRSRALQTSSGFARRWAAAVSVPREAGCA